MSRIENCWYSQNLLAWLLLPLSWLFCALAALRRWLYRRGVLKSFRVSVPVVIIGNISVGGTGKTPLLVALCRLLDENGIRAGIVSRGYGGHFSGEKLVGIDDSPDEVGDEPCLLKRKTAVPVVVGVDRPAAARLLLQQHDCDIVLSDDGLQHYRLQRDVEVAVVDAARGFGNGYCLPAGPLRETRGRLNSVDIVAYNQIEAAKDETVNGFRLEFADAVNLVSAETKTVGSFAGQTVHAVAGIGNPARFFNQLRKAGLDIVEHAYPDHHAYAPGELSYGDDHPILMTEKDAIKCSSLNMPNAWYVPVTVVLSDRLSSRFIAAVNNTLAGRVDA